MKKGVPKSSKYPIYRYSTIINNRKISRDIIKRPDIAAIIAIEKGQFILEEQNRFPNGNVIEIPSGHLKKGEKPMQCAFREFKEETGYEAKKMTPLLTFYPLIGYTTQKVHCFVATGIRNTGMQKLDKDEFLHVVKINIKDTIKLIQSEQIVDSISVCAILYYIFKKRLQI